MMVVWDVHGGAVVMAGWMSTLEVTISDSELEGVPDLWFPR